MLLATIHHDVDDMSVTIPAKRPRVGESLWFLHNLSRILIDGTESENRFSIVEMTGAPGDMPPLHVHHEEDETFYVIEGELQLHIAGRAPVRVAANQAAFAPRGVPHAYRVTSSGATRWLVACTGRSFAGLVRDTSVPALTPTLPVDPQFDPEEVLERSMHAFWERGYRDTSVDDLVNATGVRTALLMELFRLLTCSMILWTANSSSSWAIVRASW